jgi:acyl-CoA thioester hydrolase
MAGLEDDEPTAWAIRRIAVDYHRPARLDDVIEVRTTLTGLSGARLFATQQITCAGMLLVEGRIEACMTTLTGRARRLPRYVVETLAPLLVAIET